MYHWHCRCHWADSVETTWDFHHPCMILRHVEQKFSTPIFTQLLSRPTRQRYQDVTAAAEQPSRDFMNFKIRVILPVARHLVTEGATREFLALDTRKARLAEVKTWRRADMIWWFRIVDSAQLSSVSMSGLHFSGGQIVVSAVGGPRKCNLSFAYVWG